MMPLLSDYARRKKLDFFTPFISKDAHVLEIGCADGWLGTALKARGFHRYVGMDLTPPADIVGDIRDWKRLGIQAEQFDVILAFEVIEHVHCFSECYDILKPGGLLMCTSPVPHLDWLCRLLEVVGLNQKRTSPHDHLIYFQDIPLFEGVEVRRVGLMAQWGVFRKSTTYKGGAA